MIYLQLFWSFLQIGLFCIGGGYAAMPLIQSQVVTQHAWLTMNEFTNLITIAEMTPGPIAVNSATFVGIRIAGAGGAAAAMLGCILPSCVLVSVLALIYRRYRELPTLKSILASLRPAVVALIAGAGLSFLGQVAFDGAEPLLANLHWDGVLLFAAAFLVLRKAKWHPILVMGLCGVLYLGWHLLLG